MATKNIYQSETFVMRYKKLFIRSKNLILSPKTEWKTIFEEKADFNQILSSFVLPYLFLATLFSFTNYIFTHSGFLYEEALKQALSVFSSLFFTYFISYQILIKALPGFLKETKTTSEIKSIVASVVAYSSIPIFLYRILSLLIPEMAPLVVLVLYSIYLIWVGVNLIDDYKQQDYRVVLTIILSGLVICLPFILSTIILQLSSGL